MPIVRPYPIGEVLPQRLPDDAPNVPAAGDINLFGGNRARDLQLAGQNLGQASDSLFALYQREARDANDTRVQDLNNRFLDISRAILKTGPDAYYTQTGADAITGADTATKKLTALRDETLGQTVNSYQREKLGPILDAHLAASAQGILRHSVGQQEVYSRGVAANAIETSRAEATADPSMMVPAVLRAEGAARVLHAGQPPEAVEAGVRAAGGSVIAGAIGDRLSSNDPIGVALFRQHAERLDPRARRTLGAAAETLSNTLDAAAWLRDRSATLRTPAPTGDAALDAVNAATASAAESLPVVASAGTLLDQDGIAGTRERLDEIDQNRRALTAMNQQEFAANPVRLRANQAAIDTDTARSRAAVKAETDTLYADLRRHLATGGPGGGPGVTPPPPTIMSRLTDAQQDAVTAQINCAIEGRKPSTDPQTWYAIRQGLTGTDSNERQRWASTNLIQFMGRLSDEDFAALEKLQTAVRTNGGGEEQNRLQAITRMANGALRSIGVDPTPRPDASPDSDAAQAAMFHRALQDELSALDRRGRKPTEAEAYGIVNGLKDAAIKSGWLDVRNASPTYVPDFIEGLGQDPDPNVVRVAGGDKEKDRERNDARDRLPGSGSRPKARPDDELPRPRQIDPLAPARRGGGLLLPDSLVPNFLRPSPSTGGAAQKPTPPVSPPPVGVSTAPAVGGDSSPKQGTNTETGAITSEGSPNARAARTLNASPHAIYEAKIPAESAAPPVAADLPPGSFSITDWTAYPAAIVSRPLGPFRIVQGAEYVGARNATDAANEAFRKKRGLVGQPVDVHERHPVKFGGSPTDPENKVVLPRDDHKQVTKWWNKLKKDLGY